jgi:acetylglutamate kinase
VVKLGGRTQADPALPAAVAHAAIAGDALCIVHGGGDEVSDLQRRLGIEPRFIGGRRVTSPEDLELVRMVLSGTANKRLVARLVSAGVNAVGISGEDARVLVAEVTDARLGRVGGRLSVAPALVTTLVEHGYLPVVSPVARDRSDPEGAALNVNGDDAAAVVAIALGADELLFVADVAGVLDGDRLIRDLDVSQAKALIERGVATAGMTAKLQAAMAALDGGVPSVRIAGIDGVSDPTRGTRMLHRPQPTLSHAPERTVQP